MESSTAETPSAYLTFDAGKLGPFHDLKRQGKDDNRAKQKTQKWTTMPVLAR